MEFKNGQLVLCPSLSTEPFFCLISENNDGMWLIQPHIDLVDQLNEKFWFDKSGCRKLYYKDGDKFKSHCYDTPCVFPYDIESMHFLKKIGFNIDLDKSFEIKCQNWVFGNVVIDDEIFHVLYSHVNKNNITFSFNDKMIIMSSEILVR